MTYLKIKIGEIAGRLGFKTPASQISLQLEDTKKEKPQLRIVKDGTKTKDRTN